MWAAENPPPCAGPPTDCTYSNIRSSGSPPHRTPSWNSTDKSASSSKGDTASFSRDVLTKLPRKQVLKIAQNRKKKPALIIEEAFILRLQVLAELHTATQF
ncbi:hypothetical protein DFAR_2210003 [Desulfarculales bacterium]